MEKSKVYFIDFHTTSKENILDKLKRMLEKAGFGNIDYKKKMVALKIHFGEPGNMSFIRPNYARVIADMVKEKGGMPFLTDANTLYKGCRSNAIDHLNSAWENGYTPMTVGCNVIIADGLKGTDYKEININLKHCPTAKIAKAIADADIIVSINHFKGHEMACFGGALKNLGMGCGSIGGKLQMHSDSKPRINEENCTGCAVCEDNCNHDAIIINDENIAEINYDKCTGCGQCIAVCQYDAAQAQGNSVHMQEKMMEYAFATLKDKPSFHVSFIMNVSPHCDCWGYNDVPIVPDIGILASADPLALDIACKDLVNNAPVFENSCIGKQDWQGKDRFKLVFPNLDWKDSISYANKIGIGNLEYELVKV